MAELGENPPDIPDTTQDDSPFHDKNKERAKELWKLLRDSVKLTTDRVKKADVQPSTISHGAHHLRKINQDETILDVIYNSTAEEIVTLDNQFIRVYHQDGRRKDIVDCGEGIARIIYCSHSLQYVGLCNNEEMKLFSSDFELVSTAKSQHKINCMIYNESTSEVITSGPGNITTWCFRYGNRYMIPHKTVRDGLTCRDVFDHITLESTASQTQKCYAVCGTAVAVFNLHDAVLLAYKKDLHARNITSILFFNPLKFIVTGSRDGSIKVWDEQFGIKLVFVGHHGPVTSLSLYPQGPYIMSTSLDCSIRVWSMDTCDEVDLINMDEPVVGLGTTPNHSILFTFSQYTVDLWTITHVHQIFTAIGNPVQKLKTTNYLQLVNRVVCCTEDGLVRLVSPVDGSVLTTLAPPGDKTTLPPINSARSRSSVSSFAPENDKFLLDAVYCLPLETIFASYNTGVLVKASTIYNPAVVEKTWKLDEGCHANCLCMYEYILNITELKEKWKELKEAKMPVKKRKPRNPQYGNRILLLAGCKDGYISSLDTDTGEVLFRTEAHGAKGVIGLLSNVRDDQVISAGQDNVVKVWRIFPNTMESMSLLMSFYCAHTPRHMTICGTKLAVAFQQLATATYTMVVYDLQSKKRADHSPDHDHTDELTGLTCCSRLKLFASASRDGTIRIWNENNNLVRILKINDEPKSIDFCNQKGDILIGLGRNVHQVEHLSYLPRIYIFKMVCMEFPEDVAEDPIPINRKLMMKLDDDVVHKINGAKALYMRMDYEWDPMSVEEREKLAEERRGRLGEYHLLLQRESDVAHIRDGELKAKRASRKPSKRAESIAFKKYMALFWDRPKKVKIPDEDDFDPDPHPVREPTPKEWIPEKKNGFFPPIDLAKPMRDILDDGLEKQKHLTDSGPDYTANSKFIANPCGFIPNSILVKLLWPQSEVKKMAEEAWKPPTLSEEQLKMIAEMEKDAKAAEVSWIAGDLNFPSVSRGMRLPSEAEDADEEEFEDKVFYMGSDTESVVEEEVDDTIEPSAGAPPKPKKKVSIQKPKKKMEKKPSALMEKMRAAMRTPTPPPKDPTPPPSPPPPPPEPKVKAPTKPTKPIVKFVSRPPPPKAPTPPAPTPPPPTPPPPTPPPNYLTQFDGLSWFERHKAYINQRITKPYSISQFFNVICDVMGISIDWAHRCAIADALLLLWQQEELRDHRHLMAALGSILNASVPPNPKDGDQAAFLRSAVKLYQTVNGGSEEFLIEILTQYLESDQAYKNFVRNCLIDLGLQDTHVYLSKELESWEIWNLDETKPIKSQIRTMVQRWFVDWSMRFRNHLEQTMEQLRRGDIKGKIRRSGQSKTSEGKRVQFAVQPTDASLRNISPIEVVNYFCEIMLEEELERVRLANVKPEPTKNTVLVLPKLEGPHAIVRLGEMHTAQRVRHRQELAFEYRLNPLVRPYPDLMASFTNKLNLPVSRVPLNPFPSEIDKYDELFSGYQSVLITLRSNTHQKYFVPEKSYVHIAH